MNNNNYSLYKKLGALLFVVVLLAVLGSRLFGGNGAVNPANEALVEDTAAGKDYALLYKQGSLYNNIGADDKNLRLIQDDLLLFARTTIPRFSNNSELVGFTFDEEFETDNNAFVHTGHFYGVSDRIRLSVAVHETGVITLSITNMNNSTNIDEFLNLNGPKNRLLVSLPIESDLYSIRYSKLEDKVVAAFYRGYSLGDVDKVSKILEDAYGESYNEAEIIFNINAVGIFSLNEVRDYSTNPENAL